MTQLMLDFSALGDDLARGLREIPIPLYVLDRDGRFCWTNASAAALFGEVLGRSYSRVVAPEQLYLAREQFAKKIIGQAQATDYELTLLDRAGRRTQARIRSVPLRLERTIVGVFAAATPLGEPEQSEVEAWRPRLEPHLTPRQHEVLRLLGDGLGTTEIAARIGISEQTARNHVRAVLRALGAHSRLEAVVIAQRLGLLTSAE